MNPHMIPDAEPDLTGETETLPTGGTIQHTGKAWKIDLSAIALKDPLDEARRSLSLTNWIAYVPWAHPIWHSYWITGVALRDVDGMPPAKINLPGATHEIMVYALDPHKPIKLDSHPRLLTPANFVGQFIAADDAAAEALLQQTVQDVLNTRLNPDTDARSQWVARFGDSCLRR